MVNLAYLYRIFFFFTAWAESGVWGMGHHHDYGSAAAVAWGVWKEQPEMRTGEKRSGTFLIASWSVGMSSPALIEAQTLSLFHCSLLPPSETDEANLVFLTMPRLLLTDEASSRNSQEDEGPDAAAARPALAAA